MDITNKQDVAKLSIKIYQSKIRVLTDCPFFGIILAEFAFKLSDKEKSFSTDGKTIYFNPDFLNDLTPAEVDFALLHEIMHTVLKHPFRKPKKDKKDLYHLACDIVVNSNLIESNPAFDKYFTFQGRKIAHIAPNGKEGRLYSAEEVYQMLLKDKTIMNQDGDSDDDDDDEENYQQNDSSQFGSTFIDLKNKLFNVSSNITSRLYLKLMNITDYNLGFDFSKGMVERGTEFINDLLFDNPYVPVHNVDIELLDDTDALLVPTYADINDLSSNDKPSNCKKGAKFSYYFKKLVFTSQDIDNLSKASFTSKDIADEEANYRKQVRKDYLDVPKDVSAYMRNVIKSYKLDINDPNIVIKVRNLIATWGKYDMKHPETPIGQDEVIFFMDQSLSGVCTHFASAACMLYRELGIPSRVVVGYAPKCKKNITKTVYLEEGHAWVEIYIDNVGWFLIDPTPVLGNGGASKSSSGGGKTLDASDKWDESNAEQVDQDELDNKMLAALEIHGNSKARGIVPGMVQMQIMEMKNPKIDWRAYLNNFIQENVVDYSFCPPDRRFSDGDFLLPSFSDTDEEIKNILFMVDVSGSMSDNDVMQCFSEIQNAILMFDGKIQGKVGFFDTQVRGIQPFDGDTKIMEIKPIGRGGTDFFNVFKYISKDMQDNLPDSIIILSDGYAPFPDKIAANGIPVLWVITNDDVTPPWGDVTRILDNVNENRR